MEAISPKLVINFESPLHSSFLLVFRHAIFVCIVSPAPKNPISACMDTLSLDNHSFSR